VLKQWHLLALVMLSAVLAYGSALQGPLFFDDLPNLVENTPLKIDGSDFDDWRIAAFSSDAGPLRRPIAMLSFAGNHVVFGGFDPVSLKSVNLAIHLLTGALIYLFAVGVFSAPALRPGEKSRLKLAAFVASSVWLLHPLHVSTVLYSVQRMAQLSTLFTVLGLCVFLQYRQQWVQRGASAGEMLGAGLWLSLITLLATLSKENGALLPWLLAVLEVSLFQGQWRGKQSLFVTWLGWAAFLLPLLLIALICLFTPETFSAGYQLRDFTLAERLMTQARLLWHYLSWLALPDIRSMGFQHDDILLSRSLLQPLSTLFALLSWLILLVLAFVLRHRYPLVLFGLLFFLVAHVMESSVLALEMVYEHRNYLPGIGICMLFAWLLTSLGRWRDTVSTWFTLGLPLAVLLLLLIVRSQAWSSQISLARTNVVNHPSSVRAQYLYATALLASYGQGRLEGASADENQSLLFGAREHFQKMHERAPEDVLALVMLLYVDSYYFPKLAEKMDWPARLEEALQNKVLQATDMAALSLLQGCIVDGGCVMSAQRSESILDKLIARNPGNTQLLLSKYEFLLATGAPEARRLPPLEEAGAIAPANAPIQLYRIMERARVSDVAGMYEVVQNWLANDPQRWDLPIIIPLFAEPSMVVRSPVGNLSSQDTGRE